MFRGTTPTHVFKDIPFAKANIKEVYVTYLQNGHVVLNKTKTDVVLTDDTTKENTCVLSVILTQTETLKFVDGNANVQLRILLQDGTAVASEETTIQVRRIIYNGTI